MNSSDKRKFLKSFIFSAYNAKQEKKGFIIQLVSPSTIQKGALLKPATSHQDATLFYVTYQLCAVHVLVNVYLTKDLTKMALVISAMKGSYSLTVNPRTHCLYRMPPISVLIDTKDLKKNYEKAFNDVIVPRLIQYFKELMPDLVESDVKIYSLVNSYLYRFIDAFEYSFLKTAKYGILNTSFSQKYKVFKLKTLNFAKNRLSGLFADNLLFISDKGFLEKQTVNKRPQMIPLCL